MRYLILAGSIFLCSCVQQVGFKAAENNIDPRFQPYVHAWMLNYTGEWPAGLKMQFGTPPTEDHEKLAAYCERLTAGDTPWQHTIFVKEDVWERAGVYQRESIIMHELGHCVPTPKREHVDAAVTITIQTDSGPLDVDCPTSWMTTAMKSEGTYADCREILYLEMFGYGTSDEIIYPNYKPRAPAASKSLFRQVIQFIQTIFR